VEIVGNYMIHNSNRQPAKDSDAVKLSSVCRGENCSF
jgi:hypothetical protein